MKKLYLLLLATLFAVSISAQQQLAVLDHNDTLTVYYGADALNSANTAAVNGDIITLTGGTYNTPNEISKAITIRGAGMYADTANGTLPTIVTGTVRVTFNGTASSHTSLEGIRFSGDLVAGKGQTTWYTYNISHLSVSKCYINSLYVHDAYNKQYFLVNSTFIDCIIYNMDYRTNYPWYACYGTIKTTDFINCVILNMQNSDVTGLYNSLTNCVAKMPPSDVANFTINNSILFYNTGTPSSSSNVFNSIGINTSGNNTYFDTTITNGQNLHNYSSLTDIFQDFNGSYSYGFTTFRLNPSISNLTGSDGTQIGIYGGPAPFEPSVRNVLIGKLNVGRRTNAQGKLEVNVDIIEAQ